ncbi:MAG TPA: WYL domain-containing protein [Gammaproteobacteria bacterium]|nr:WYL domain-containing protein [Gammaproteobacteria bacterium]
MNTAKIIDQAISEKKTITFEYDGHSRTVEPHHYGTLGGSLQLHGYQVKGGSVSGKVPNWRNFKLDKIDKLAKNDVVFEPESTYNPLNSKYEIIEKKVTDKK